MRRAAKRGWDTRGWDEGKASGAKETNEERSREEATGSRESSCGTEGYMVVYYILGPRYIRLRRHLHIESEREHVCVYAMLARWYVSIYQGVYCVRCTSVEA